MFSKFGFEPSAELAREYVRRGEYFYRLFVAAGSPDEFEYSEEDVAGYAEGLAWLDFITSLDVESPAFGRGIELRTF